MRNPRSFAHSPMLVFYELTKACDLVCQHCRACAQPSADPNELGTEDSKRLIEQLAEFPEPPLLILTGGDPLKRQDIYTLIEHARACGLEVSITPSATPLMTRQAIARLRDAGIARMAISIDGSDAATHEAMRGVPGSYQRALDILRDARELGLETQINTTLTPANFDQIEAMGEQFAELGIVLWSMFFLIPVGRAEEMDKLDAEACEAAFYKLWRESKRRPYMVKTTEAMHYRRFLVQQRKLERADKPADTNGRSKRPEFVPYGVNDGKGVMFVSHAGLIQPSGFLPMVGGLFPWQSVVKIYQDAPLFRALRDVERLEGKCGRCEFKTLCGGSRARAFATTGNLFAEEPDCCYQPTGAA